MLALSFIEPLRCITRCATAPAGSARPPGSPAWPWAAWPPGCCAGRTISSATPLTCTCSDPRWYQSDTLCTRTSPLAWPDSSSVSLRCTKAAPRAVTAEPAPAPGARGSVGEGARPALRGCRAVAPPAPPGAQRAQTGSEGPRGGGGAEGQRGCGRRSSQPSCVAVRTCVVRVEQLAAGGEEEQGAVAVADGEVPAEQQQQQQQHRFLWGRPLRRGRPLRHAAATECCSSGTGAKAAPHAPVRTPGHEGLGGLQHAVHGRDVACHAHGGQRDEVVQPAGRQAHQRLAVGRAGQGARGLGRGAASGTLLLLAQQQFLQLSHPGRQAGDGVLDAGDPRAQLMGACCAACCARRGAAGATRAGSAVQSARVPLLIRDFVARGVVRRGRRAAAGQQDEHRQVDGPHLRARSSGEMADQLGEARFMTIVAAKRPAIAAQENRTEYGTPSNTSGCRVTLAAAE
jgi:hypothetical protein